MRHAMNAAGRHAPSLLEATTFTGALRLTAMTAPVGYDDAMNGNVFFAYREGASPDTVGRR
jgi:hypothetical protein